MAKSMCSLYRRWRYAGPLRPCFVRAITKALAVAAVTALVLCRRHGPEREAAGGPVIRGHAVVVGIFTSYSDKSAARRRAILDTWLPQSDSDNVRYLFVIGDPPVRHTRHESSSDGEHRWSTLQAVQAQVHGRLLHLAGVDDTYGNLPHKSAAFFTVAGPMARTFVIKLDDDVFFRPSALPAAVARWHRASAGYIGCLKSGHVETRPGYKWHEPPSRAALFGDALQYPTHAWGSTYAVSAATAASIAAMNGAGAGLRMLSNEDVSVGIWALATGAVFLDDRRLCAPTCEGAALSVWDFGCTGLCSVDAQQELQDQAACRDPPAPDTADEAALYAPFFSFEETAEMNTR